MNLMKYAERAEEPVARDFAAGGWLCVSGRRHCGLHIAHPSGHSAFVCWIGTARGR